MRLRTEMRSLRGTNAQAVLHRINPIVRGWSAYYSTVVSSDAFHSLDNYMWMLIWKWAKRTHRDKSKGWIARRYFGTFNPHRPDPWVFGDRSSGFYMHQFGWANIIRHEIVKDSASADNPSLIDYWAARRRAIACPICPAPMTTITSLMRHSLAGPL